MADGEARIRELTYRLMQMAPEPPPFPVGPAPARRPRPVLVWAAAAVVVVALIALPVLFLLPTSDEPAVIPATQPELSTPTTAIPPPSEADFDVIAFLVQDGGAAEAEALADELRARAGVTAVDVFSRAEALAEARALFADEPVIRDLLEEDPSILPWSVRLRADPGETDAIVAWLETVPGVNQVVTAPLSSESILGGVESTPDSTPASQLGGVLTLSADRGAPGDALTVCGTYRGDAQVSLDVWQPETGYRWAAPIQAVIEPAADGSWCWEGEVPASVLGIGPQHDTVSRPIQPGAHAVVAASYPEDYAARAEFVVDGIGALGVGIDQGWAYVSTEPTLYLSGHAFGHDVLELSSRQQADLEVEIVEAGGRFEAVVPLTPGTDVIRVVAQSAAPRQADAVAEIAVRYLPEAELRVAYVAEVRPEAGEIIVDFAELLQGEAAFTAAAEDGATVSPLTGLYVDNAEELLETVPIEANPPIILWSRDEVPDPTPITYEEWLGTVPDEVPYWLTIHEGTVVQVEQRHIG